jgi:hypothetical protein
MATQSNSKTSKAKSEKPAPAPAAKPVVKVAAKPSTKRVPTQEEISTRAYEIYVAEGCPEGSSVEHWLRAERELGSGG